MSSEMPSESPKRVDSWSEKWATLQRSLRLPIIVDRIWNDLLTAEERERVEKDDAIGPDIVDIWAKLREVSMNQAALDLGVTLNVITAGDRQWFLQKLGEKARPTEPRALPLWDRKLGRLFLDDQVIKRVRRLKVATNAILILDAFQEMGWPPHLEDPLPPKRGLQQNASQRLLDAIKSLNKKLTAIRFRGNGKGTGIVWERL